jgi:hypothetical protein
MEFGINVDSLRNIVENEIKNQKKDKKDIYKSKIVEYSFFVQNEIENCEVLNCKSDARENPKHRFLTIQKYDFVKICESNRQILEKMNFHANKKKFVLLKYNEYEMLPFIECFFYHNHINNTSIFSHKPRASFIFWDLIQHYEVFFNDFLYLANNHLVFLDFSSKNLLYDKQYSIFLHNFERCLIKKHFDISKTDFLEYGNLQKTSKYIEIEANIDKFVTIIDSIEYFGNKHFDLYFSKQLIKTKNFNTIYENLDTIIDDYLNNLYFLKNFSDTFKNDNKTKWKSQIKTRIEENIHFLCISPEKLNWKLYLIMLLEKYQYTVWETFSLNSLFLNITYYMMKIFNIQDNSSLVHRYFKFLFKNMDISCTIFNNNNNNINNINIMKCKSDYNKYRVFFEYGKDFYNQSYFLCLSHVTIEQQQDLYDFLSQSIEKF